MNILLIVGGILCCALGTFLTNLKNELEPSLGRQAENIGTLFLLVGVSMLGIWLRNVFG